MLKNGRTYERHKIFKVCLIIFQHYERVNKIIHKFCSYTAHVSSGENGFRKSAKLCDGMKKKYP